MMEEGPEVPEPVNRRSKRARVGVKVPEFTSSDRIGEELDEEMEESSDDLQEPHRRARRNKATDGTSTSAAVQRRTNLSLIEVIKGDGKGIPDVTKCWVEKYERNKKFAMAELLTMVFQACGAKYRLKEEDIDETDVDNVVVALVKMARRGEIEDYQNSKRDFKHFRENLVYFLDNLVSECQNGPLFDQSLFDRFVDYIIALSCTPPRFYRQIASLIGLQLVTSFISVAKMLGSQRETTQRQLDAEKKNNVEGPRVESLTKRLSMTQKNIITMEEIMRKIFTGLFVHRYRDIDSDIRLSCIESLGVWVSSYPSLFLQDLYLKYLGWTLNDKAMVCIVLPEVLSNFHMICAPPKSAGVRKASILALQNLYEVDDNVPSLNLFSERFSRRMVELADDIDISVTVCAIGLVKQLLRHRLVLDEDLGSLYDLLIDDPPEVRRAIGGLVYDHLIAQKFNDSTPRSIGANTEPSEIHISRMLKILREFSADPALSSYVIDDVWEYMKAMKDWKCIIRMLLESPQRELDDMDAANLIRLFFASVRKAVGERIVPATDNRNLHQTKAQKAMFESNKRDITVALMTTYTRLLSKYMSDKKKVGPLVEIIVHMNLELYSLKREELNFKDILRLIREAFFKHGEKDALRSCVKGIKFCATESRGELQDFASNQVKELEDELISKLKFAIKDVWNGGDDYSLLVNLKRLYELQLSHEVPLDNMYQDLARILQSFTNIDDEVASSLLGNMFLHVCWCLRAIESSDTPTEASLSSLLGKRDALLKQLEIFLGDPVRLHGDAKSKNKLAYWVCGAIADIWCLFRRSKFASSSLEMLGYGPDNDLIEKYWKVCEQLLNDSDDEEDEDGNRDYVEETNSDTIMFALCKLLAKDSVPKEYLAPEIVSRLAKYGASVGEIVKHLLTALRKKGDISTILVEALKRVYRRYLLMICSGDDESMLRKSFLECKDLAARLSESYVGAARNKYKSEILNIVKEGINYAFLDAPRQLSFLDAVVLHFVTKLPAADMLEIIAGVERRIENVNTDDDASAWRVCYTFVDALREKVPKHEGFKVADGKEGTSVRRRGRPRKLQNVQGKRLFDEHISSGEEDSVSESDQDVGAEEKQEEDEEDSPLIHAFRSLKSSHEDERVLTKSVDSVRSAEKLVNTPKTSGASS